MKRVCFFVVAALIASAGVVHADEIPVDLSVSVDDDLTVLGETIETDREGGFEAEGSVENEAYTLDWEIGGHLDPALVVSGSITNLTNAAINVAFLFATPVIPFLPPSGAGGSIAGSVTDGNGDGVTLSNVDSSLYTALVNGTDFRTLGDSPFNFTSAVPFGSAALPVLSFGIPGLTEPGPGVLVTDMGILVAFQLSAHDSAAFTANFVLEPRDEVIPEPATLGLMVIGLAGFAGRALRRRKCS
ncbi:MAG: PEP-CTERM sorting domain-containing protein [FCB group bacterium]|jgi:hypothetical protein|nr:PEP-CTERM sorting domain-containing protein [FCB group bacterium]